MGYEAQHWWAARSGVIRDGQSLDTCLRKVLYRERWQAEGALRAQRKKVGLLVYRCPWRPDHWHLGRLKGEERSG